MKVDRIVVSKEEEELKKKKSWFSRGSKQKTPPKTISRPPSVSSSSKEKVSSAKDAGDSMPERIEFPATPSTPTSGTPTPGTPAPGPGDSTTNLPMHAGFDFNAIQDMIQNDGGDIGMSKQSPTPGRLQVHSVAASASALGPPPPYSRSVSVPLPPLAEKGQPEKQRSVSVRRDLQEPGDLPSSFDRALSLSESDLPVPEAWPEQGKTEDESGNDHDPFSSRASAGRRGAVGRDAALGSPSARSSERGGNRDAGWGPSSGGGDPFAGEHEDETDDEDEYADFETGISGRAGGSKPFGSGYPTFGNGFNHTNSQAGSAFSGTAVRSPAMESTVSFGGSVWGKETNTFTPLGGSTLGSTSTAGNVINNAIGSPSIASDDFGDFEVGSSRVPSDPGLSALSFGSSNLNAFAGAGSAATLSFGSSDGFPIGGESEAGKRGEAGASSKTSATDYWIPPPLPGQKKRNDTENSTTSSTSVFGSNPWG